MTTQVALLEEETGTLRSGAAPLLVPLNVSVLIENKVRLDVGGPLPSGVDFDPATGGLSLPVGYYQIEFTIVTAGSFKQPAISFEISKDTYMGLQPTSLTTASIFTQNGLLLGSKEQLHDYTLLVTNGLGRAEAHDPVILFEPPG